MIALKREAQTPRFVPDYMAKSLADVDFVALKNRGVKYIAFDADSTLVNFYGNNILAANLKFLNKNRSLFKAWCIASNRINKNLKPVARSIDADLVQATLITRKPNKRFFAWVLAKFGAKPGEVAMIGDKLIADMFGGKRAGMVTVWVEKTGHDNPLDYIFRVRSFEKWLMKNYHPKRP